MDLQLLNGTQLYWFTSMGLIVGLLVGLIIKKEGVSLIVNIFWGVIGANVMGVFGIWIGFGDGLWFSFIATLPFLFLINVFHTYYKEGRLVEAEHYTETIRKKK